MNPQKIPHGVPHQINLYTRDIDSPITAYGKHKRCVVTMALTKLEIIVRVDEMLGHEHLPWPTLEQVLAVASSPHYRLHSPFGRLRLVSEESEVKNQAGFLSCRYYTFEVVYGRPH